MTPQLQKFLQTLIPLFRIDDGRGEGYDRMERAFEAYLASAGNNFEDQIRALENARAPILSQQWNGELAAQTRDKLEQKIRHLREHRNRQNDSQAPSNPARWSAGAATMTKEEDVLAALDQPRALYALQTRLDPSNKNTDALQELLIAMRAAGTVKFDIYHGKWRKA